MVLSNECVNETPPGSVRLRKGERPRCPDQAVGGGNFGPPRGPCGHGCAVPAKPTTEAHTGQCPADATPCDRGESAPCVASAPRCRRRVRLGRRGRRWHAARASAGCSIRRPARPPGARAGDTLRSTTSRLRSRVYAPGRPKRLLLRPTPQGPAGIGRLRALGSGRFSCLDDASGMPGHSVRRRTDGSAPAVIATMAQRLELTEAKLRQLMRIAKESISLELPVGDEGDATLGDFIEDGQGVAPLDSSASRQSVEGDVQHWCWTTWYTARRAGCTGSWSCRCSGCACDRFIQPARWLRRWPRDR
jgi:Sigma-70 region 3